MPAASAVPSRLAADPPVAGDGSSVLLVHGNEVALNESARVLWSLCDGHRSIGEITQLISDAYERSPESTLPSIASAIRSLESQGALTLAPGDLSDGGVFRSLFGDEVIAYFTPSAELVWHLEAVRRFVFGVFENAEELHEDVVRIDLDENALENARSRDADTAASIGTSETTPYPGLFDSPSFRETVSRITAELAMVVPDIGDGDEITVSGRAYYPAGGAMGWHSNHSHPALRIYCTWSERPKSNFFRYLDPRDDSIITDWEPAGWTLKAFHIPPHPYRLWHCIGAGSRRLSLGFRVHRAQSAS